MARWFWIWEMSLRNSSRLSQNNCIFITCLLFKNQSEWLHIHSLPFIQESVGIACVLLENRTRIFLSTEYCYLLGCRSQVRFSMRWLSVPLLDATRFQVRSGHVFTADALFVRRKRDKAATGFSLPNMERRSWHSSFSRLLELLTRALSQSRVSVSGLIETSTYFQCIAVCFGSGYKACTSRHRKYHR
jgi:hypothetical protein